MTNKTYRIEIFAYVMAEDRHKAEIALVEELKSQITGGGLEDEYDSCEATIKMSCKTTEENWKGTNHICSCGNKHMTSHD